ncbi:NAD-dependent epimerase/dehydratase family protein [Pseudomonas fluorescens]|uniref:UDP-glucose 4-epimerase n=1 Tax=Pseudomonas fluorescens TaxID=294 RepID=A0A5E7DKN3_PSEFL|nr:SDR family oxidoreductase [Pseudomonas fluorescens]VVO17963.1 UDP-glucose 4-epimerase [Pseudomonas fluorescens]VVP37704.1 UDP-glucose 4-epimerase [Pseudomonas fluorescens]
MSNASVVLVTGGAGYIGSRLVPKLLAAGYRVRVLDAQFFSNGLELLMSHPGLEFIKGDIRDKLVVEKALQSARTVIHLAAVANDPSFNSAPEIGQSINIDCLPHLMGSAKRLGCQRFIYASSASVYGISAEPFVDENQACIPVTDYNRFKAQGEKILFDLTDSNFQTVAVRAATVCGWSPRQRLDLTVNILTANALARGEITVFGGSQYRPNVHIGDLTRLYMMLVQRESLSSICGTAINVGYENHTVSDIADQVKNIVDKYFSTDVPITSTASNDVRSYRLDSRRVQQQLGFEFIYSIRDAVLEICEQWQSGKFTDSVDVLSDTRYHNVRNMQHNDWSFPPCGDTSSC